MDPKDHALLVELDARGMSAAADSMERLIRSQDSPPAHLDPRCHEAPVSIDLALSSLSAAAARRSLGAGGGRRRPVLVVADA